MNEDVLSEEMDIRRNNSQHFVPLHLMIAKIGSLMQAMFKLSTTLLSHIIKDPDQIFLTI